MLKNKRILIIILIPIAVFLGGYIWNMSDPGKSDDFSSSKHTNPTSQKTQSETGTTPQQNHHSEIEDLIKEDKRLNQMEAYYQNIKFPYELSQLKQTLSEEFNIVMNLPQSPEKDLMLMDIGANFAIQFSRNREDLELFGQRIKIYEETLLSFGEAYKPANEIFRRMISKIPNWEEFSTEDISLREHTLLSDYENSRSSLVGEFTGEVIAQRLASAGPEALTEIQSLPYDEKIKINIERSLLNHLRLKGASPEALTYYLSSESRLDDEPKMAVKLVGDLYREKSDELGSIVLDSPPGDKRDQVIFQIVARLQRGDEVNLESWLGEISNPSLRDRARKDYLENLPLSLRHIPPTSGSTVDPFEH
ncbi:hypothetical protein JIN85_15650 [Luteolibacter pohnpeiensis]|uniref:Uncharacterized protein n=1 Tax=Luteolibacter pohnpeiensis TaxID=454153 RepID=A0A934VVR9_9BACT|nr:hypothetical protein [Luteolibacter pohnpeiensis]MBK1883852.1 hypothetical protein [Luteolibacter pohnpeiensis]